MIPTRSVMHPLLRNRGRVNDGEMLQTDVMRFMAILGLCLTAVFALVQSLPMEFAERQQQGAALPQQLQQARAQTERTLQQAQQRLAEIELQLANQQRRRQQGGRQLQDMDARLQQQSEALLALQSERSSQEEALQALSRQLQQAQALNRALASEQAQRTQALQTLGRQLEQARKASKQMRLAALEVPQNVHREQVAAPEPVAAVDSPRQVEAPLPEQPREGNGFLLRFASVETLDGLVKSGAVGFAGVVKRQAWKLSLHGGKALFVAHAAPHKMHEMSPQTVPPRYLRAFTEAVGDEAAAGVVWGVMLPAGMERKIRALTEQVQGGILVIHADGEVRLTEGGRA